MTAPTRRPARGRRRLSWPQWSGALVAVVASVTALSLPGGPARAATAPTYNQITGVGPTASAITVPWTNGLLNAMNQPITGTTGPGTNADRTNQSSSLWFMYQQFQNLSVTVSQTQDLGNQGVTVSWTWTDSQGNPVSTDRTGTVQANFLQMMECYGDASSGPDPDQCQYGSTGLLPSGVLNPGIGTRTGELCTAGAVASTTNPPASADGSTAPAGCDPLESGITQDQAPCPTGESTCPAYTYDIPFAPVTDPTDLDYTIGDTQYFNEFDTDEVQEAVTANGAGQQQFETLNGVQAPGLGCGEEESSGSARNCWLVIVPRGTYEPNGYQVNGESASSYLEASPLSASNWDQRIQIAMDFSPVGSFCPSNTPEIQTFGTQLLARAMQSWQLALNQSGNCNQVYAYSAVPESTTTQNLEAGGDVGLAFTTIPIGSEATRDGEPAPTNLPNILYAPIAVAAVDFGFNINYGTAGYVTTPVELTPLLLAKALTQSFREDLPDYFPDDGQNGPAWAANNPLNISEDSEFHTLNPDVPQVPTGPIAPLVTEDHSAVNQQIWGWIQADSTTDGWLNGTKDPTDGMTVDPQYQALSLGTPPALDSYPEAYTGILYYCSPTGPAATGSGTASGSSTGSAGTSTTTTLTVAPIMSQTGLTVTLSASEVAADKTNPAGSVQFEVGGTDVGQPVAVNASGVASTTTTFSAAGSTAVSAVFTPTSASYDPSTATYSESVCSQAVETKDTTDLLPYTDNFQSAAQAVLTANDPDLSGPWDTSKLSPSDTPGWWDARGVEALGQTFMWGASDTPDLAAYGLIPAELCDDSGATCIQPSTSSLTAAVTNATADSAGLLEVNPASPGTGAYPLTFVVYAAVATNQSATALENYANLISYAVGSGQTAGTTPGDLPPGYLPLPSNLVSQAQGVVTQLQNLATGSPSPSASASTSPSPSVSTSTTASSSDTSSSDDDTSDDDTSDDTSTDTGSTATTAAATTAASTSTAASTGSTASTTATTPAPTPVASLGKLGATSSTHPAVALGGSNTPGGPVISLPPNQNQAATAGKQPDEAVGPIRWTLIAIALAGGLFAGGGTLLRSGGLGIVPGRRRRTWGLE
jgi:hypothetical protein